MSVQFAKRMEYMRASEIRELLKLTENPEVISFAGGTPAPDLFPIQEIARVTCDVLAESGKQALQYGTTEGFTPLREIVAQRMNRKFKTDFNFQNILITSGSQQGLDFSGKIFLNEGDVLLCEKPMYLAAINAFRAYMPQFVEVPTDDEGMISEELERLLQVNSNIKLIYVVPDFQNPTGIRWSLERRRQFMQVINQHDVPVVEDNPYGELVFEGEIMPSLKSMDKKGQVICLGTFSKTFCPGLRIGWVAAETNILEKFILVKQSADLHSSTLSQRKIAKYIEMYDFDANIEKIKATYKKRRDTMLKAMEKEFPAGVQFTHPKGGLFTWVELPSWMNARDVLVKSLEKKVAFVPGGAFYPNGGMENTMRLNFSNMPEDRIEIGIKRLANVLQEFISENGITRGNTC
jgi:Transcriptional regulators containing a DNA-binding HTH domain and an aminotransferase domain (MocR family) and their eukaryotic orthologs